MVGEDEIGGGIGMVVLWVRMVFVVDMVVGIARVLVSMAVTAVTRGVETTGIGEAIGIGVVPEVVMDGEDVTMGCCQSICCINSEICAEMESKRASWESERSCWFCCCSSNFE